jgi:D-glycero-D-manno-heptose 1,7-bisphosphate phosphatase
VTPRFTAAFVDRDGTLNAAAPPPGYVTRPEQLRLLPGAADAVRRLTGAGLRVVVVSNQQGVARGLMSEADLAAVTDRLLQLLGAAGAPVAAVYSCPHPAGSCACHKPLPGLLLRAAAELPGLDLTRSVTVGDAERDVTAGRAAGTATVRLGPPGTVTAADHLAADLTAAADWILRAG